LIPTYISMKITKKMFVGTAMPTIMLVTNL
jgi:hypothetical protein